MLPCPIVQKACLDNWRNLGGLQWCAPGAFRQSLSLVFSGPWLGTAVAEPGFPGEKDSTTCREVSKPDTARQVSNKPTRRCGME
jgi:hypothetical protein